MIYTHTLPDHDMSFMPQNFLVNVVESQIGNKLADKDPAAAQNWTRIFDTLNLCFTMIFTAELVVNLFVNWFKPFIQNGCALAQKDPHRVSLETAVPQPYTPLAFPM